MLKSTGDEGTLLPKNVQKALKTALNMCKFDAGKYSVLTLSPLQTCMVCSRSQYGLYHDFGYLGLKGLNQT